MNKIKTMLIVICMTLAVHAQAAAQNGKIEGVVLDQNGAPVSGAQVSLAAKSKTVTRTTNGDGQFTFDAPVDTAMLTIRASGFATTEHEWRPSDPNPAHLSITLAPEPLSEQMVVTAARTETRVSDAAASVVMLSSEALATTAALTLDDALRQVPGFTLFRRSGSRTANPTTQGVSLRGVARRRQRRWSSCDAIPLNVRWGWGYWACVPREFSAARGSSGGARPLRE